MEGEEVGEFVVVSIALLEPEFGWFYVSCKNCNRKVITKNKYLQIAEVDEVTDDLLNAPSDSIWCRKEKKIATQVSLRFRITMRVQDNTGNASFVMWDREVKKVLGLSASDIRQRQLHNNDENSFSHELDDLLNQKLAFKIKIDDYLVKQKGGAYSIIKMCDDPEIISELIIQDDNNEVQQATILDVSTFKLGDETQSAIDSKDAFSVACDSLTDDIEKESESSPKTKRLLDTPGVGSSTESGKRGRKAKLY